MFGECHAHIFMDGINYREAVKCHKDGADEKNNQRASGSLQKGRNKLCQRRRRSLRGFCSGPELAPEYDIDYRTSAFAIHKAGHYGSIVGKSFTDLKEFHSLVLEAGRQGADFIKIMTTGLLDFADQGKVTGTPLDKKRGL